MLVAKRKICDPVSESKVPSVPVARIGRMESKLAQAAGQAVLAAAQRLRPEERVDAFLAHSRFMVALYHAAQQLRATPTLKLR
jgi:hypothetical protein